MVELFSDFWDDFSRPEHLVGHIAYFFLILSMLMRSMNWLRFFAITAGTISVIYYTILGDKVSMFWEGMFTLVNLGQYLILLVENRRGRFSADEVAFIKACLADVERANARRLMKLGAWIEVKEDAVLVTEDKCPVDLKYIVGGSAIVTREGRTLGEVSKGESFPLDHSSQCHQTDRCQTRLLPSPQGSQLHLPCSERGTPNVLNSV